MVRVNFLFFQKDFIFYSRLHRVACGILVSGSGIESMPTAFGALSFNPWITREVLKLFIGEYRHVTPQLKSFQGPTKALRMKPKVITGIHVAQKDPLTPHSNLTSLLCCSSHHCLCCTSCLQPLTSAHCSFCQKGRENSDHYGLSGLSLNAAFSQAPSRTQ